MEALEQIIEEGKDDATKAQLLHKSLCDFTFIISLKISKRVLCLTYKLSQYLQAPYVDLNKAIKHVELIETTISNLRTDVEFKSIFKNAELFGIPNCIPRIVGLYLE